MSNSLVFFCQTVNNGNSVGEAALTLKQSKSEQVN